MVVEPGTIEHVASLVPQQEDDAVNPVKQATVTDPSGATVLLWEAENDAGGPAPSAGAAGASAAVSAAVLAVAIRLAGRLAVTREREGA